nr:hypothetical protein Ahn.fas.Ore.mt_049 [Ahnfeltia fastigiata]
MKWNNIDWRSKEIWLTQLQLKIFKLSKEGDISSVFTLQKQLVNHESAKLLAIRRITQDNLGKRTAGVDGISKLNPVARLELLKDIKIGNQTDRIRRVTILKPSGKERHLGIPTIRDRVKQSLLKFALEPQYEAVFEPNSYGFRPGRNANDARKVIVKCLQRTPKFILDADIKGCFDEIKHSELLKKIETFPLFKDQIEVWLKAGIMIDFYDQKTSYFPKSGTPQGGVISPLLANIALHGMEELISKRGVYVVRYADDFLILCNKEEDLLEAKQKTESFLSELNLELSKHKTRMVHSGLVYNKPGVNFLGFNFINWKVGIHRSAKDSHGNFTGWKGQCKPSVESIRNHLESLRGIIKKSSGLSHLVLISKLAPIISGWTRYFSVCNATKTFSFCSMRTYNLLQKWSRKKAKSSKSTPVHWFSTETSNWVFGFKDESGKVVQLRRHDQTNIASTTKVLGESSPYDGKILYWSKRLSSNNKYGILLKALLKAKGPKCGKCKLYFTDNCRIETHHIMPRSLGGSSKWDNLQLLHGHCHDKIHFKYFKSKDKK